MKKIILFTLISIAHLTSCQNECLPARCSPNGPLIRFPFQLKGHHPQHCGYPGFDMSCTASGSTQFDLQFSLTASTINIVLPFNATVMVDDIDYGAQKILASNAVGRSCLPDRLITTLNSTKASPFELESSGYTDGYTLFNCSIVARDYVGGPVACLSSRIYKVIAVASFWEVMHLPPYSSCFKMYNISNVPGSALTGNMYGDHFYISWRKPVCGNCEAQGKFCRLKDGNDEETECFSPQLPQHGSSRKQKPVIAGITLAAVLLLFIVVAAYFILSLMKRKREVYKRIAEILENHKGMNPRRYSYADIKKMTHNFEEKIGEGTLFKGMLNDEAHVAVKIVNSNSKEDLKEFVDEVERIGRMQHDNVLQLIGYCVNGYKKALVYEFLTRGPLEKFIFLESQNKDFGWETFRQISVSIAKGIDYLHQECNRSILVLNIDPRNILLDHNSNPKILVLPTEGDQGVTEYTAPEIFSGTFSVMPEKAYVYNFGMLLVDTVRRVRKTEEKEENEIVKKLLNVGLWCVQWFPCDRPSMKEVIQMLEGVEMPVMPPSSFPSLNFNKYE